MKFNPNPWGDIMIKNWVWGGMKKREKKMKKGDKREKSGRKRE